MSFASRKLYPGYISPNPPPTNCCQVVCDCVIQSGGGDVIGGDVSGDICICPAAGTTAPCVGEPPNATCNVCTFIVNRCLLINGGWWRRNQCFEGGAAGQVLVCLDQEEIPCICNLTRNRRVYPPCVEPNTNPCCPTPPTCISVPGGYNTDGGIIPLFDRCEVRGSVPHTYRIENVGFVPFPCGISNSPQYPTFFLDTGPGGADITGAAGDPDLSRSINTNGWPLIRYHKVPSEGSPIGTDYMVDFSRYCLKLHETQSQRANSGNRAMVFSGRNVYKYTGVLSGDPRIPVADPLWDDPGASGLSQLEGFLGRSFPLPDSYLTLPLWGETASDNMGLGSGVDDGDGNSCTRPYIRCCGNAPSGESDKCDVCIGCNCISSDPHSTPLTGHYLPNDQGYTAGYFSFACFNPFAYLDCEYRSDHPNFPNGILPPGDANQLGFGWLAGRPGDGYGCDQDGNNCAGFAGATAHGTRLGFPTCSVWSLIKSVYARVLKAITTNGVVTANLVEDADESWFRNTAFPNFSTAVTDALSDNPAGTRNGTSNVQYHLARIANALYVDSESFLFLNTSDPKVLSFTFPNVFLWDKNAYLAATTNEQRWQNLFIVGNGNVLFDSASAAITGPAYSGNSTDYQDYRSFVFTLDEVTHNKTETVTPSTNHARLVIFNGSHGPVDTGSPSNNTNPSARVNATSKISLTELPFCAGITSDRYPNLENGNAPITLCEICNAWPNEVCLTGTDPACGTVNGLDADGNVCMYIGGYAGEGNCMTANYAVPGGDLGVPLTTFNFSTSTETQPYALYVDPEIMLGFAGDPWSIGEVDTDDPTGALSQPYLDRLAAVSYPYKYMQQNVGGRFVGGQWLDLAPVGGETPGYNAFKMFYDRLSNDEKKTVMIELEVPWLPIISTATGSAPETTWKDNVEVINEFKRQEAMDPRPAYLAAGQTPGSVSTTLYTYKEVTKRYWKDACQYAKDNGSENVILFTNGGGQYNHYGIAPWSGVRSNPTLDGRSWWRSTDDYRTLEQEYDRSLTSWMEAAAEAGASADANIIQLYNFFATTGSSEGIDVWNSYLQRLVPSGGGSAAAATDFNLDDLNYWARMTMGANLYQYRNALTELDGLGYNVDPLRPVAAIVTPSSHPIVSGSDGGNKINNRWLYMKEPSKFSDIDIGGLFTSSDENVTVSYPDQVWVWDASYEYNIRFPFGTWNGNSGTGSSTEEFVVLGARCQWEKILFGRPYMQTVAEGGLSSESELTLSDPDNGFFGTDSALAERRRAWLRANTLPNVYWDNRTQNQSGTWFSEGLTNDVRFWSAVTGSQLPSPLVFDRNIPLAPWLNFNNDIRKSHVRVAMKHWVSDRNVRGIERSYKLLSDSGIAPLV